MSERRHPPSARRVREARRNGEVAVARDLCAAAALALGAIAASASVPQRAGELAASLRRAVAAAAVARETIPGAPGIDLAAAAAAALGQLARTALPPCLVAALGAAVAGAVQSGGLFAPGAATARWDRLNPRSALRRLSSGERLLGLARAALTAVALLAVGTALAGRALAAGPALTRRSAAGLAVALGELALGTALAAAAVLATGGALELLVARLSLRRRLSTTREEALRERRQEEGDPRLTAERRRMHRALAAAGPVARATCLVVNPTHVAVALRHDPGSEGAPVVLAKGAGREAARLRALARRAGVPVVHDPALARALLRLAEVGDAIPEELYRAAAAVLLEVHRRAGQGGEA